VQPPAFARRAAVRRAAIDRCLLPAAPQQRFARKNRQTDGRTDGRTDDRCIDPAPHTMLNVTDAAGVTAVSIICASLFAQIAAPKQDVKTKEKERHDANLTKLCTAMQQRLYFT